MARITFPIHHTFGPLVTPHQWRQAFKLQFQPWRWRDGPEIEEFRSQLSQSFGMSASLFATGRDGLLAVLRALDLSAGDEVILQGYTCIVVPNAIHAAGGVPVYVDIDPQTLNIDINKIQTAITPRTKAIICQHTFGIPADTKKLRAICDKRSLALIEDAAHVIPDSGGASQLSLIQSPTVSEGIGVHGDAILFSFGRDKAISGVTGGAILTRHRALASRLAEMEKNAEHLSKWQVLNLIDYPIRYQFAKWIWRMGLGKIYLRWIKLLGFLPPIITKAEKDGKADIIPKKLPNACATLALDQLKRLSKLNDHRRKISQVFLQAAKVGEWDIPAGVAHAIALQKFPIYTRNAEKLRARLKREQVYLDDGWCGVCVSPRSVDQETAGYEEGSCPTAEEVTRHIVTLPTHPTMTEAQARYLVHALRSYVG